MNIDTEIDQITLSLDTNSYNNLTNKPSINSVTLTGNKTSTDLNLQHQLTAGENITIENNIISANLEENWEEITSIYLEENVTSFNITEDSQGNPLSLKKFYILSNVTNTSSIKADLQVNNTFHGIGNLTLGDANYYGVFGIFNTYKHFYHAYGISGYNLYWAQTKVKPSLDYVTQPPFTNLKINYRSGDTTTNAIKAGSIFLLYGIRS